MVTVRSQHAAFAPDDFPEEGSTVQIVGTPEQKVVLLATMAEIAARQCEPRPVRDTESARRFLESNYSTLPEQYGDEWIAIHEGRVVAHNSSIDDLGAFMDDLPPGIRDAAVFHFVHRVRPLMFLVS